jgi:hypothetical protein
MIKKANNRKQLLMEAIKVNKEVLTELNHFAANVGHPNPQVMLAVLGKISQLKTETAQMETELKQLNEKASRKVPTCTCGGTPFIDSKCKPCLETLIKNGKAKIVELREWISGIEHTLDDASYFLELWNEGKHPEQFDV